MTYCCGMLLRDGLVMIADTRTNAGLDNVSVFRKLRVFGTPGERVMGLASSGNLSVSQSVVSTLNEGITNPETGQIDTLTNVPTMFQAVQLIGRAMRQVHIREGRVPEGADPGFNVAFLFGGEIKGDRLRLFMIYPEGNSIECTVDTPYLQIGEHKYGKPVLDRAITYGIDLYTALKIGLISVDSTMRSNLGVGLPLDVLVVKRGAFDADLDYRINATEPYYRDLRDSWSKALRNAQAAIPVPSYKTAPGRRLAPAILTDIDPEDALETGESVPPRLSSVKGS
jgi:putative proteasome-type protease